jgi:diguanylate cyclase (GGDEF)-like protein
MERENLYGKHCSYWGTAICNTQNCGIACAKRGLKRTYFKHGDKSYQGDVEVLSGIDGEPTGFIEVVQDITQVREMALKIHESTEQIKQLETEAEKIYYCPLTGIYNRRYFDEYLTRVMQSLSRSGGNLSLMMVDVDHFKRYNDTYGHSMGDECLKTVAEALSQSVTRGDDIVARYGGEEFAVVLPNTDENGAQLIAEKLLENIREENITHEKSDAAARVTISVGITTGKAHHTQTAHDYIKQADKMLYESKQNGRDRYTFEKL